MRVAKSDPPGEPQPAPRSRKPRKPKTQSAESAAASGKM
jgi:hypothetical protein